MKDFDLQVAIFASAAELISYEIFFSRLNDGGKRTVWESKYTKRLPRDPITPFGVPFSRLQLNIFHFFPASLSPEVSLG